MYSDVVGDLLAIDETTATLRSRDGLTTVLLASVAIAKLAPPSTADELALERVAAAGWRAAETAELGGWLLRASDGFTGRGNSVLPLRPPGMPLDDALVAAQAWYAARGLPVRLQVPVEARRLLDAELGERGWAPSTDVHVLAARLDNLPATPEHGPTVSLDVTPGEGWFARYRDGAGALAAARGLLTRHDNVCFAEVRDSGRILAVGRGVVDESWLGVTAVEVDPQHRRQGLASAVMLALRDWAVPQGASRGYLQVSSDNAAAVGLYTALGYWHHHDYRYRDEPKPLG